MAKKRTGGVLNLDTMRINADVDRLVGGNSRTIKRGTHSGSRAPTTGPNLGAGDLTEYATFEALDLDKAGPPQTANSLAIQEQTKSIDKQTGELKKSRQAGAMAGGFAAIADMMNAYGEYIDRVEDAKTNIMLAEHDFSSIIAAGKDEAFKAESAGFSRGQDALLLAAIQGQDVGGILAQNLQHNEETFGAMEALAIEVNSLRQAHGVRQEIVLHESEMEAARQDFENQMINGTVRLGIAAFGGV